jgi:hypothetical protein
MHLMAALLKQGHYADEVMGILAREDMPEMEATEARGDVGVKTSKKKRRRRRKRNS